MAKRGYWTPKRRAAFKRMRAGLKRTHRVGVKRRVKRRRAVGGKRRRNPAMILANPSTALVPYYYPPGSTRAVSTTKRKKRTTMRKRRKARRASPTRRRRRTRRAYTPRRRRYHRRPRRVARRRSARAVIYVNPRHRRRRHRRLRRRRNPSGMLRMVMTPIIAGFAASFVGAAIDKFVTNTKLAALAKVGAIFAVAFGGRRSPRASVAAMGSLAGSLGYPMAVKLLGGMTATTTATAVQGLAGMSRTNPQIGALLNGGMGALLSGVGDAPSNLPVVASNYMTALRNNVHDDD